MAEAKKHSYKYCIVPMCESTTFRTPSKVFFHVPNEEKQRMKWCNTIRRDMIGPKSSKYVCEDHFDIEEDTANYIQYKIMLQENRKVTLRLKPGTIPHKFQCQMSASTIPPGRKQPQGNKQQTKAKGQRVPKDEKQKESASEPPIAGSPPAADAEAAPADELELEVKVEPLDEWAETADPLRTSPEPSPDEQDWSPGADQLADHDEISLPSSPPDIKEEVEFKEEYVAQDVSEHYEAIISKFKEEIAELKSENKQLADENRRLEDQNRVLSEKSRNLTSGIDQLLQKSEHEMTNYEHTVCKLNMMRKLEVENKKLRFSNEQLRKTISSLNNEIKKQATSILQQMEKKKKLVEKVEQLKGRILHMTETKKSVTVTELKRTIEELEKSNQELVEEILSLKTKNKSLMEEVGAVSEGSSVTLVRKRSLNADRNRAKRGSRNQKKRKLV